MKLHIYDSVKKEKIEFNSIVPNVAKIYVCGPTVYDDSHLGHARSAIAFDFWSLGIVTIALPFSP